MTTEATPKAITVTVTESLFEPSKGYVAGTPKVMGVLYDADLAQAIFQSTVDFWKGGQSEVLEQDSNTVEIQVGGWRRVMVDMS